MDVGHFHEMRSVMYILKVKRQEEPLLITAVRELCDGNPTPDTDAFLRSLDRPIENHNVDPVLLFGTNFDVDYWNQEKIDSIQGQAKTYRAVDSGEK